MATKNKKVRTKKDIKTIGYNKIKKIAKVTDRQLSDIKDGSDRDNPIDMDILKTTKSMFYEQVIEVIKEVNKELKKIEED